MRLPSPPCSLSTLDSCRIPLPTSDGTAPPSPSTPSTPASGTCIDSFQAALAGPCGGSSLAPCCSSLEALGEACLEEVANAITDDQTFQAFSTLLGGCGWSVTTSARLGKAAARPDAAAAALGSIAALRSLGGAQPACPLCGSDAALEAPATRRSMLVTAAGFRAPSKELVQQLAGLAH